MLRKVCDYIKQNKMIEKGDRIVVGVSGGADSICLLYVLDELCMEFNAFLTVVHVNHGIRGVEADRDEKFVSELCSKLNIEYHSYYYDVKRIAKEENLTEEEAGRKVRYQAFIEVSNGNKCNKIAIAHNKNDTAETVLFHLFRGTGMKGLSGIDPRCNRKTDTGNITIIRPLLCVERKEIETYLKEKGFDYRIDATNLTDDYSRNKIRNHILTYAVKEINRSSVQHIAAAASQLKENWEFVNSCISQRYTELVKEKDQSYYASVRELLEEDIVIQKGIIRKILERLAGELKDIEAKHVDQVLSLYQKQVGRQVHLPYHMIVSRGYHELRFFCDRDRELTEKIDENQPEQIEVKIPGKVYLPNMRLYLITSVINHKKSIVIPKNSCTKWFDYDKIENTVVIRTRNEGDYIQINRFGGRKKIKDYFIDHKIPKEERDQQLLISDGSHIIWILGEESRISEKYKVEDTTKKILLMKLIDVEEEENGR